MKIAGIHWAEQSVQRLGWEMERSSINPPASITPPSYRAYQGGFKTLWRPTPEQVFQDVKSIVEARKSPENVPF